MCIEESQPTNEVNQLVYDLTFEPSITEAKVASDKRPLASLPRLYSSRTAPLSLSKSSGEIRICK